MKNSTPEDQIIDMHLIQAYVNIKMQQDADSPTVYICTSNKWRCSEVGNWSLFCSISKSLMNLKLACNFQYFLKEASDVFSSQSWL